MKSLVPIMMLKIGILMLLAMLVLLMLFRVLQCYSYTILYPKAVF